MCEIRISKIQVAVSKHGFVLEAYMTAFLITACIMNIQRPDHITNTMVIVCVQRD